MMNRLNSRTSSHSNLLSNKPSSAQQALKSKISSSSNSSILADNDIAMSNILSNQSNNNILVSVRLRPESAREKGLEGRRGPIVRVMDNNMLVFDPSDNMDMSSPHKRRALGVRRGKDLRFAFDRVFDENSTQMEVYNETAKGLIDGVMDGYNATVFAYGATGAGKTFTMMGNDNGPGVLALTMIDLFNTMERTSAEKQYKVVVSFLEVYNETLRDLLADPSSKPQVLELREDKIKGVSVSGLSEHCPANADEVLELVTKGTANRTQFGTAANLTSSRSHAVFQILIEQRDRTANIQTDVKVGKLSLIDLAGSERASVTKNRGARLVEGANINKSLLALANCINALGKNKGKGYVPYRNSKLTRLLKDSLGGNCRTVMIANVSPNSCCYDDTFNTLKYANRAKNIKTSVVKNVHNVNFHITKYTKIIDELRAEVSELKRKLAIKAAEVDQRDSSQMADFERERTLMYNIRATLARSYQEQISDRKLLMEIEENDRQNALKVLFIRNEIRRWEREHSDTPYDEMPLRIHTLHTDAEALLQCTEQYVMQKERIRDNLQANISQSKTMQEKALVALQNEDLRQMISLQTRIHDLEVMNLDLERMSQHHRAREQRLKLVVEDAHHSTNKIQRTLIMLFERLRESDLVTPDVEMEYNTALMHCTFVAENMNDSVPEDEGEGESPISKLNNALVHDALKTPTNISVPGARKRKLRFGEPSSPDHHSAPNSSLSNSPMHTSPMQKPKKIRIHSSNTPPGANTPQKRHVAVIPMMSLDDLDKDHEGSRMDISEDESENATARSLQTSPREPHVVHSPHSTSFEGSVPRSSATTDSLRQKFQQFEDFVQMNNSARTRTKEKVKQKHTLVLKKLPAEAWGEKSTRKGDDPKKTSSTLNSKKVKFTLPLDGTNPLQPSSGATTPRSQSSNSNGLPSYMQSTASAQSRVSHTLNLRPKTSPPVSQSFDFSAWQANLRNKENAPAAQMNTTKPLTSNKTTKTLKLSGGESKPIKLPMTART